MLSTSATSPQNPPRSLRWRQEEIRQRLPFFQQLERFDDHLSFAESECVGPLNACDDADP